MFCQNLPPPGSDGAVTAAAGGQSAYHSNLPWSLPEESMSGPLGSWASRSTWGGEGRGAAQLLASWASEPALWAGVLSWRRGVGTSMSLMASALLLSSSATSRAALRLSALAGVWAQRVQKARSSGGSQPAAGRGQGLTCEKNTKKEGSGSQRPPRVQPAVLTVCRGLEQLCGAPEGPLWRLHHGLWGGSPVRRKPLLGAPPTFLPLGAQEHGALQSCRATSMLSREHMGFASGSPPAPFLRGWLYSHTPGSVL